MTSKWCSFALRWPAGRLSRYTLILVSFIIILIPRVVQLGQVCTVDEKAWGHRSHQFIDFVMRGEFQNTVLRHHPGVTLMWITGSAGYLAEGIDFVKKGGSIKKFLFAPLQTSYEHELTDRPFALKVRQTCVALVNSIIALLACVWLGRTLNSGLAMVFPALLIGLDPFYLGLSRIIHCDGLMASFSMASCMALLRYLFSEHFQYRWLIISGVLAGLGLLSKITAGVIVPWTVLVLFVFAWFHFSEENRQPLSRFVFSVKWMFPKVIVWCGTLATVFISVWPAMWVNPGKALGMFTRGALVAAEGAHPGSNASMLSQDVGIYSYLPRILIFSAPWTVWIFVFGISFLLYSYYTTMKTTGVHHRNQLNMGTQSDRFRWFFISSAILLLAILVVFSLGLFEKQAGRYILTAMVAINILAAIILCRVVIVGCASSIPINRLIFGLLAGLILWCGVTVYKWTPYATGYRHPIWGNLRVDGRPLLRGWGEGIEKAAEALNKLEGSEDFIVAARRYWILRIYLKGKAVDYSKMLKVKVDYIILYEKFVKSQPDSPFIKRITENCRPFETIYLKPFGNVPMAWIYESRCYYDNQPLL